MEQKYASKSKINELSGKEYTNFINGLKSIETRKQYSYSLLSFMKFTQKTLVSLFLLPKK